jgi:hypothetical protein
MTTCPPACPPSGRYVCALRARTHRLFIHADNIARTYSTMRLGGTQVSQIASLNAPKREDNFYREKGKTELFSCRRYMIGSFIIRKYSERSPLQYRRAGCILSFAHTVPSGWRYRSFVHVVLSRREAPKFGTYNTVGPGGTQVSHVQRRRARGTQVLLYRTMALCSRECRVARSD